MGRILFFTGEALRALRRSASPSVAAIVTVVLTTLLLGIFVPVIRATSNTNENVREELTLRVFMNVGASEKRARLAQKRIARLPHVARTEFVTKEEGLKILQGNIGNSPLRNSLEQLRGNPLPYSIVVHPDDANNLDTVASEIEPVRNGRPHPVAAGIQSVDSGQSLAHKINTVTNAVKIVLLVISALLLVISLMLIANTIRLSIYARRREVEVMRLVGATNWFIRWPFVLEGLLVGVVGAGLAIGLLWLGKVTVVDPLARNLLLIDNFSTIGFGPLVAILLSAAILISALGSGVTLRRFLRV